MIRDDLAGGVHPVTRRRALTLGTAGVAALCLGCAGASRAEPPRTEPPIDGQFGSRVDAGALLDVQASVARDQLVYVPSARTYLVTARALDLTKAKATYPTPIHAGLDVGLLALFQKCTHLGCRVPYCATSQMFECPCHDGIFSGTGEWRSGVPPRGMDLFPVVVSHGRVVIDTATVIPGLGQTVDVSGQQPAGPHCI